MELTPRRARCCGARHLGCARWGASCSLRAASSAPAKQGHYHGDACSEGVDRGLALVGVRVLRERVDVVLGCRSCEHLGDPSRRLSGPVRTRASARTSG